MTPAADPLHNAAAAEVARIRSLGERFRNRPRFLLKTISLGWSLERASVEAETAPPPGTRKSSVFSIITQPLLEWERAEAKRLGPEIAKARAEYEITEQRLKEIKNRAAKAKEALARESLTKEAHELAIQLSEKKIPTAPRLFTDDVTPEALASLLFEQIRPALTLGLCVQPDVIESLSQKPGFRGRGLLGRILYALPQNPLGHRKIDAAPVPPSIADLYQLNVLTLLSFPWGVDEHGDPCPFTLKPSPEARELLKNLQSRIEPQLAEGGELGSITDWAGKLARAVARIAGLLHLASNLSDPWQTPINSETMQAAIQLGDFYTAHAKAAFSLMGSDPVVESSKRILAWIKRAARESFSIRDLCNGLGVKRRDTNDPLQLLAEHDYIRPHAVPPKDGPGQKPSPVFDVNPSVLT